MIRVHFSDGQIIDYPLAEWHDRQGETIYLRHTDLATGQVETIAEFLPHEIMSIEVVTEPA
jgi:hypothetical protein